MDVQSFLDAIFEGLAQRKIDVSKFQADHLCYRVATLQEYELRKVELARIGALLHETVIGGRPIATYKFHTPLEYGNRLIPLIELPAPKKGSPYPSGFEHVEFVINESFESYMARYPDLVFELSGATKKVNPEIRIELDGGLSVKFHHQTLEDVIACETAANRVD